MRRIAVFLAFVTLAVAVPAGTAAAAGPTGGSSARPKVAAFCRATDGFLRFFAKAPDPSAFKTARGKRVLRTFETRSPRPVADATARIADSFTYLSVHGRGSLSKARDEATGDALFRAAAYSAAHCKQRRVQVFAANLVQRRIAQHEAEASTTTTTTPAD